MFLCGFFFFKSLKFFCASLVSRWTPAQEKYVTPILVSTHLSTIQYSKQKQLAELHAVGFLEDCMEVHLPKLKTFLRKISLGKCLNKTIDFNTTTPSG